MLPDHALSDITANDIVTLRLKRDPLIDALLDCIQDLQADVAALTTTLSEAESTADDLREQLEQARWEIRHREMAALAATD